MSQRLEVLYDADNAGVIDADAIRGSHAPATAERALPAASSLATFYGGPLRIPLRADRPTIVANFVSTLDGVVSFGDPGAAGGSAVSGGSAEDHRLMGLLRTLGDAVMVGAGTVRRARNEMDAARHRPRARVRAGAHPPGAGVGIAADDHRGHGVRGAQSPAARARLRRCSGARGDHCHRPSTRRRSKCRMR